MLFINNTSRNNHKKIEKEGLYAIFRGCTSLKSYPYNITLDESIPAQGYAPYGECSNQFQEMFGGCTSLVYGPSKITINEGIASFYKMFDGCSSLLKAPSMHLGTLNYPSNFDYMFYDCKSLKEFFEIPNYTISAFNNSNYWWDFNNLCYNCSNLKITTNGDKLGAHKIFTYDPGITTSKFSGMFDGCACDDDTLPAGGTPVKGNTYYWVEQ